ncbi:MAG: hypothetical protein AB7R00_23520 [Kofleriaceae bacterium]
MMRFLIIALALLASSRVEAAPKKYHFKLAAVTAKDHVKPPEVASAATKRVEGQIKKTFTSHAQLVATLDGAPDPIANADAFRKFLKKKGLAGAYLVTVEVTGASEEVEPMPDKPNSQRLVVRLEIHMLGETIPGRTMGFTGDGKATIKQEVGRTIRDRDREYAWDSAAEVAIAEAMTTVFKQLAVPPKKQ